MRKQRRKFYSLYECDSLEWLKARRAQSIHAVVTDPPYGLVEYEPEQLEKMRKGDGGIWRIPRNHDGTQRAPSPRFTVLTKAHHEKLYEFHLLFSRRLHRVLVPGAHCVISCQGLLQHLVINAFLESGMEYRGSLVRVVKTLRGGDRPIGANGQYDNISVTPRACWEPWLVFRKPLDGTVRVNLSKWQTGGLRRPAMDRPFIDLYPSRTTPRVERAIAPHPSLKPQAFLREIVRGVLPLGVGIVLDPFMGSGSTIAAASAIGYRSIGIEVNPQFYDMAVKSIPRLSQVSGKASARKHRVKSSPK